MTKAKYGHFEKLPFVDSDRRKFNFWKDVVPTGDYHEDHITGAEFARQFCQVARTQNPSQRSDIELLMTIYSMRGQATTGISESFWQTLQAILTQASEADIDAAVDTVVQRHRDHQKWQKEHEAEHIAMLAEAAQ